jgi:hypothetical protein
VKSYSGRAGELRDLGFQSKFKHHIMPYTQYRVMVSSVSCREIVNQETLSGLFSSSVGTIILLTFSFLSLSLRVILLSLYLYIGLDGPVIESR